MPCARLLDQREDLVEQSCRHRSGVVAFRQPHVPSMSAGLDVANVLPEKQLLTEFIVPNTPPSSPMS